MNFKKIVNFFFSFTAISTLLSYLKSEVVTSTSNYKVVPLDILADGGINATFAAKFVLFVAALLLITVFTGKLLKIIFRLPTVAGQIIGGIFLGPSLLNIKNFSYFSAPLELISDKTNQIFSIASSDLFFFFILLISSALTVSYLLWLAGHETDVQDMAKVGIESTLAGFLGAVIPIFMISGTIYYLWGNQYTLASCIGLGVVFAATSVSIPVAMLISQKKMYLRSSKATMGAAIVDDILAIILFSIFIVFLQTGMFGKVHCATNLCHTPSILHSLIYMIIAFLIMFIGGKFFITPVTKLLDRFHYSHLIPSFATLMMLSYFAMSDLLGGLAGITGAYFAGLFHRMGDTKHKAERSISPYVNSFLLPLFLGSVGMQVDISVLGINETIIVVVLLFVAIISKLLGCQLTTMFANLFYKKSKKWNYLETYLFGSSMVARGEVGLVIATILNGTHLMTPTQYIICVSVIVLTTIASPIMLAIGFAKLDEKENEEKTKTEKKEYTITIGPFEYISSHQIFDILTSALEKKETIKSIVQLSEAKKVLSVDDDVKIILRPEVGITFEGKESKVKDILHILQDAIKHDIKTINETVTQ